MGPWHRGGWGHPRSQFLLAQQLLAPFADEADDEGGPAGLVGGAEAFAGFGVEVLVEEEEVLPVRFLRVAGGFAKARALAVFAGEEEGDETVAEVDGDFAQVLVFA